MQYPVNICKVKLSNKREAARSEVLMYTAFYKKCYNMSKMRQQTMKTKASTIKKAPEGAITY